VIEPAQAGSALLLGLAGAGHCLGMCGGMAAALNLGGAGSTLTLCYHGGRIASYVLLGALLGLAAGSIDLTSWTLGLRYLAGFLLVGMGLYVAGWWRGMMALERAGAALWRPVQRLAAPLLPPRHWYQSLALGLCWGLMPCGLIYSSLAWAGSSGDAASAATLMLFFGLGTLPAMLSVSFGAQRVQQLLRRRRLVVAIGVLLILSGVWTVYIATQHRGHDHSGHGLQHVHGAAHGAG